MLPACRTDASRLLHMHGHPLLLDERFSFFLTPLCRSIFCCLAPSQGEQYVRQDEGPVVIRPIAPQPPAWAEPVLGPQLPQDAGKKTLVLDLGEQGG